VRPLHWLVGPATPSPYSPAGLQYERLPDGTKRMRSVPSHSICLTQDAPQARRAARATKNPSQTRLTNNLKAWIIQRGLLFLWPFRKGVRGQTVRLGRWSASVAGSTRCPPASLLKVEGSPSFALRLRMARPPSAVLSTLRSAATEDGLRRTGMKNGESQSGAETAPARPAGVRACRPGRGS